MNREKELEKLAEKWENLTLANDFIFSKVMRDKELCKSVLELLLPFKIKDIKYLEYQKDINIQHDAKSIRLDIYVEDGDNIYNIEMQVSNAKDLKQRVRFYQSLMDLAFLEKGEPYAKLKPSYIIFLCMFDPFNENALCYTFQYICKEYPHLFLEDGTHKIFFNVLAYQQANNEKLKSFFAYLNGIKTTDNDPFLEKLSRKVEEIKGNQIWRTEFMNYNIYGHEEFEKGKLEGMLESELRVAKNLLDILDDETIALKTGLALTEVQKLRDESKKTIVQ